MKNSKQYSFPRYAGMAVCALAACLTACHTDGNKEKEENLSGNIQLEIISWEENPSAEGCKIAASYPVGANNALNNRIREWMNEQLGGIYADSLQDGKKMITFYGQNKARQLQEAAAQFGANSAMGQSACYVQFKKVFETGQFVSYTAETYEYAGGAHGGESLTGGTFRKTDGRKFEWDMFTAEGKEKLRYMIKNRLKAHYFKAGSDEDFYNMLLAENARYEFPLPETAPICRFNGMEFVYQQYEIAPYAAGLPSCILPYDSLKAFVTTTAQPLLESTTDSIAVHTDHIGLSKLNR